MTYINKNQPVSLEGRSIIQAWLSSKKDEDSDGNDRTHQQYLDLLYEDATKSGESIWKTMVDKRPLKQMLLREQGFVCCYCGRRILLDQNTLEHLTAKGAKDENGDYINKRLVFDYDNLMACCFGSSKKIIHIVAINDIVEGNDPVEVSKEVIKNIAKKYAVSEDKIEELYINDTNYEAVMKEYDIEDLRIGDNVLIIKRSEKEQQHCGPKKDDIAISIHPLQFNCADNFKFKRNESEGVELIPSIENDKVVQDVIDTLGLNNNIVLNTERKKAFETALDLRNRILKRADRRTLLQRTILSYAQSKKHAPSEDYADADFFREPFWFVKLAVLTGKFIVKL